MRDFLRRLFKPAAEAFWPSADALLHPSVLAHQDEAACPALAVYVRAAEANPAGWVREVGRTTSGYKRGGAAVVRKDDDPRTVFVDGTVYTGREAARLYDRLAVAVAKGQVAGPGVAPKVPPPTGGSGTAPPRSRCAS